MLKLKNQIICTDIKKRLIRLFFYFGDLFYYRDLELTLEAHNQILWAQNGGTEKGDGERNGDGKGRRREGRGADKGAERGAERLFNGEDNSGKGIKEVTADGGVAARG